MLSPLASKYHLNCQNLRQFPKERADELTGASAVLTKMFGNGEAGENGEVLTNGEEIASSFPSSP